MIGVDTILLLFTVGVGISVLAKSDKMFVGGWYISQLEHELIKRYQD